MMVLLNRVTEKPKTGDTLWIVSAEWRGGHDRRKFLLENVYNREDQALTKWNDLTPENHNAKYGLAPDHDAGFVRHPIRMFKEATP